MSLFSWPRAMCLLVCGFAQGCAGLPAEHDTAWVLTQRVGQEQDSPSWPDDLRERAGIALDIAEDGRNHRLFSDAYTSQQHQECDTCVTFRFVAVQAPFLDGTLHLEPEPDMPADVAEFYGIALCLRQSELAYVTQLRVEDDRRFLLSGHRVRGVHSGVVALTEHPRDQRLTEAMHDLAQLVAHRPLQPTDDVTWFDSFDSALIVHITVSTDGKEVGGIAGVNLSAVEQPKLEAYNRRVTAILADVLGAPVSD